MAIHKTNQIIQALYTVYDALNEAYFGSELPEVFITIASGKTKSKSVYGTFTPNVWGTNGEDSTQDAPIIEDLHHEILIASEHLTRPFADLCSTLQHEMVHLYCEANSIVDTSNNGVYHNKRFKAEAEQRGLIIDKAPVIGWSLTTPNESFRNFVDNLDIDKSVFDYFRNTVLGPSKVTPKKRWVCPNCGMQVQGKKDINVMCGDCMMRMDYVNLTDEEYPEVLEDFNEGYAVNEGWIANLFGGNENEV